MGLQGLEIPWAYRKMEASLQTECDQLRLAVSCIMMIGYVETTQQQLAFKCMDVNEGVPQPSVLKLYPSLTRIVVELLQEQRAIFRSYEVNT